MASDQQQGLLLIPDISGFTEFVSEVEISHSEHIITELLEILLNTNSLELQLVEIEGDALFFFRLGAVPSLDALIEQARRWYIAFHAHLNQLRRDTYCKCGACQNVGNLGLKVVGHAGNFVVYRLADKMKVIGKDVIVVHRLLKNEIASSEYLLLSDAVLEATGQNNSHGWDFTPNAEEYPVLGEVAMAYAGLEPLLAEVPTLPELEEIPTLDGAFAQEIVINARLDQVAEVLCDHGNWPKWIEGMTQVQFDPTAPLKSGHRHVCVFPNVNFDITLDQVDQSKTEFRLIESVVPPTLLKRLMVAWTAIVEGDAVRVEHRYIYSRKPILGRIFEMKGVPMMRAQSVASLANLKRYVEEGAAA